MPLDLALKIRHSPASEVGITIPYVLSRRLDLLVESCDRADIPTNRKEVVAALLLAAPTDGAALQALLRAYREASVADARVGRSIKPLLQPDPRNRTGRKVAPKNRVPVPGLEDLTREARLCRTFESRLGLSLPGPLSARLDVLVDRVRAFGENTTRQETFAALLLASPSGAALAEMVQRYWRARIRDAIIEGEDIEPFLDPQPPRRGPRPRHRGRIRYTAD